MATNSGSSNKKVLGIFTLAMINVAAIVSLRNLPLMAEYGLAAVFFYVVAGLSFFIPVSLVAAELATTWPKTGGIYIWVKEAFGSKYGFLAIWMEWIEDVVWFPTVLSFAAATTAYIFMPSLAENKFFMVAVMLVVFWGSTFANFLGMKASGLISTVGVVAGTIIPGSLIIILAIAWLIMGKGSQISFSPEHLLPDLKFANLSFFAGVILGLAGMEMAAFHAQEAKNPQKDYPKAILLATIIILALFILGSLAIAVVVPANEISLVAGLMQAFEKFFGSLNLHWLVPIIAFLTAIGALAQISTWIIGPSKGLLAAADSGDLPSYFQRLNKNHVPVAILLVQGGIGTILSLVFLLMPTVSTSYWILSALTAQLTALMYLLLFAGAIRLRYSQPNKERPYRVPMGRFGIWLIAGIGLLASLFTLFIGFVPPTQLKTGSPFFYVGFLLVGIIVLSSPPFILDKIKKPSWGKNAERK